MTRRQTRCSADFEARALQLFPIGGTAEGNPGFERFAEGPLAAAQLQFALAFDDLPYAVDETVPTLRFVMTAEVPLFPAMVFYGVLVDDGAVELVDVCIDDEYWAMLDADPDDEPF